MSLQPPDCLPSPQAVQWGHAHLVRSTAGRGTRGAARPGVDLLVLFGSRARGDAWERSDWDFAYLAGPAFEPDCVLAELVLTLGTDRVDLVDLAGAGGQLRYRVASEGRALHASGEAAWNRFWWEAVSFWCDAQPIIRRGYERVLSELTP